MIKKRKLLTTLFTLIFCVNIFIIGGHSLPVYAETGDFYVSPLGNDNWSGTLPEPNSNGTDGPFKTILKARNMVRTKITNGMTTDINVMLRGGSYYLDTTITFDEKDSGRDGHKVIYRNYPGEEPVINGGQAITGWQVYQGNIYKANVGTNWKFNTLFENGKYSIIARYPNEGYNRVSDMISDAPKNKFKFNTGDIPSIPNINGLQVYMWPGGPAGTYNWFSNTMNVQSIDYTQGIVTLGGSTSYEMGAGSRYYVQGALELLDKPGEFYLDKVSGILYYWPRQTPIDQQDIVAPKLTKIIDVKGSSNTNIVKSIQFEGLTIRNTDYSGGYGAIQIENASDITVKDCIIHNTGMYGVLLQGWTQNNVIYGNKIYDIGHTGIQVNGPSGGSQYTSKFNTITNNNIYNTGLKVGHGSGIQLSNSGDNLVSHNRIHNTTRYAISMKSPQVGSLIGTVIDGTLITRANAREFLFTRNNRVEYNDVYSANTDSQDTGVIESWGVGNGNVINNNHIHDSNIQFSFGFGIYLDDGSDYTTVSNNIVDNLQKGGNGVLWYPINARGMGNSIVNNIVADNNASIASFGTAQFAEPNRDITIHGNIFYKSGSNIYDFFNWKSDWTDYKLKDADYNLYYNSEGKYGVTGAPGVTNLEELQNICDGKYEQYSITADPKFIDSSVGDYRLRYDSPAYSLGFQDIDVESIGLLPDYKFADPSDPLEKVFVKSGNSSSTVNLSVGGQANLTVTGRTVSGYVDNLAGANIQFSSDNPSVTAVDSKGIITAAASGVAKITVSVTKSGITKKADIYVVVGDTFNDVKITTTKCDLYVNQTLQLKFVLTSLFGQTLDLTGATVTYDSDNESVLSVNDQGLVTAKGEGTAKLTVSVLKNGIMKTASTQLRVYSAMLSGISVSAPKQVLNLSETSQLSVSGTLTNGKPVDFYKVNMAYFSSDSSIAEVDSKGFVKAIKEGRTTMTVNATLNGTTKSAKIDIFVYPTTGGNIQPPWQVLPYGSATGFANFANNEFTIYSNGQNVWGNVDDFIYVNQNVSLPASPTKVSVTATVNSLLNTHTDAAAGIMFRDSGIQGSKNVMFRILPGGGLRLTYRTADNGATQYMAPPNIVFPAELKLTREGNKFTAFYKKDGQWLKAGQVTVEMDNDILAGIGVFSISTLPTESKISNVVVETEPLEFSKVVLSVDKPNVKVGDSAQLTVAGYAGDYAPVDLTGAVMKYSSDNEAVATVDSNGKITAKGGGTATITLNATLNGKTVSGKISISTFMPKLVKIDLSSSVTGMRIGETQQVKIVGTMEDGSPANLGTAATTYTSSNDTVAVVSPLGIVTAKESGIASITATVTLNGITKSKSFMVIVNNGVNYNEGFENGISGWTVEDGIPKTNSNIKRSGNSSLVVDQDREILARSLGTDQKGIFECWFYEDGKGKKQTVVNFGSGSLGIYYSQSSTNYVVMAGNSYTITSVLREEGWHQITVDCYTAPGKANVYIDGVFAVQLPSSGISYIGIGDWWKDGSISNMYFDDITVYNMGDTVKPQTTANVAGNLKNGWYSSDVTISLTAVDDFSGIAKTEYSLDGGAVWNIYSKAISITSEGIPEVKFRSSDKAGNVEETKTLTVSVDKSSPLFKVFVNGAEMVDGLAYDDSRLLTFDLTAEDSLSGVKQSKLLIDGNPYELGAVLGIAGKPGAHTVTAAVYDNAGNYMQKDLIFNVTTDTKSLRSLMERYEVSGDLGGPLLDQLTNNLDQVEHKLEMGYIDQAVKHLEDFKKHLNNEQMREHVSEGVRKVLNTDADAIIQMLQTK